MNNKYSNFLTILLILIIIAIVGIIAFLGFKFYQSTVEQENSEKFVESFGDQTQNNTNKDKDKNKGQTSEQDKNDKKEDDENKKEEGSAVVEDILNNTPGDSSSSGNKPKYNGFLTVGTIEIPATNLKSPILDPSEYSDRALDTAVVQLYGPGLNQVGNTTISGHNYRNGRFFSNNKKLKVGDKIFITDLTGKRLTYTIYEKFEAEVNYSDYMVRDTQGAIEISLSTCTDDSKARIIILARADV
jgi:LPXTG-site transpeptidase (sortase) family protein